MGQGLVDALEPGPAAGVEPELDRDRLVHHQEGVGRHQQHGILGGWILQLDTYWAATTPRSTRSTYSRPRLNRLRLRAFGPSLWARGEQPWRNFCIDSMRLAADGPGVEIAVEAKAGLRQDLTKQPAQKVVQAVLPRQLALDVTLEPLPQLVVTSAQQVADPLLHLGHDLVKRASRSGWPSRIR